MLIFVNNEGKEHKFDVIGACCKSEKNAMFSAKKKGKKICWTESRAVSSKMLEPVKTEYALFAHNRI